MALYSRIAFLLLAITASGCKYIKPSLPTPERVVEPNAYLSVLAPEREVLGTPDWGLAISGGGIRSATIAIGALKALHDQGVLDHVDAISTVSGGGYAAYWLYSREYRDPSRPGHAFGAKTFGDSAFLQEMCGIATTNNFVSTPGVIGRWLIGRSPTRAYANAIRRTFGQANYDLPDSYKTGRIIERDTIEFHELREFAQRRVAPNWIVNSRVYRPEPEQGYHDGIYELTPFGRGTGASGYAPWTTGRSYPVLDGVSASGAAVAFALDRTLPSDVSGPGRRVQLSDGGHGENLGMLSLVRRRAPNIIVIDAEQDRTLSLNSYRNLKARLLAWGDTLVIPELDTLAERGSAAPWRPATGTTVGRITGKNYSAKVYYMKLSIPRSLDSALAPDPEVRQRARAERERLFDALRNGQRLEGDAKAWDCRHLASMRTDLRALGIYEIQMFVPAAQLASATVPRAWSSFPHRSTFDLTYNLDRTMAQVALGYLLGEELAVRVRRDLPQEAQQ